MYLHGRGFEISHKAGDGVHLFDRRSPKLLSSGMRGKEVLCSKYKDGVFYNGCLSHDILSQKLEPSTSLLADPVRFMTSHYDWVIGLGCLDGSLISASRDKSLKVWNVENSPVIINQNQNAHSEDITLLHENSSEDKLLSADNHGIIKIWGMEEGRLTASTKLNPFKVSDLFFQGDGLTLLVECCEWSSMAIELCRKRELCLWRE